MEIVVTAILGIAATIIAAYVWETKIRDRISVKRIMNPNDKDIPQLLELYVDLFPNEISNYSSSDIMDLIEHQNHSKDVSHNISEDFIMVAKCKSDVIGFLLCHFYPEREKAIISYYGIDKNIRSARTSAAHSLLSAIHNELTSKGRSCKYLFFDVERPTNRLTRKERAERKARVTVFKQSARSFGRKAFCIEFDYSSPRITLSTGTRETPLTLMTIPLASSLEGSISRETLLEFLSFIYFDCYGDIYELNDPHFKSYQDHVSKKLEKYSASLPAKINLA